MIRFVVGLFLFGIFLYSVFFTFENSQKKRAVQSEISPDLVNTHPSQVPQLVKLPRFEPIEERVDLPIWSEVNLDEELEELRPNVESDWMQAIALAEPERFFYAHEGDSLEIIIPNVERYTFVVDDVIYTSSGARHWNGHDESNRRFISVTHLNETTLATLLMETGSYSIRLKKGKGWIYQDKEPNFHGDTPIEESTKL